MKNEFSFQSIVRGKNKNLEERVMLLTIKQLLQDFTKVAEI